MRTHRRAPGSQGDREHGAASRRAPGKQTRVQMRYGRDVQHGDRAGDQAGSAESVHQAAAEGVSGAGGRMPHLDAIQRSFGGHDVSHVQAHVDGASRTASESMGAEAYAMGTHVAFKGSPSLFTAAHEAAHVVQQRGGVQLEGGVGQTGDRYEQQADEVASLVVQGKSAEHLLDQAHAPSGGVQMRADASAVQRLGEGEAKAEGAAGGAEGAAGGAEGAPAADAGSAKAEATVAASGVSASSVAGNIAYLAVMERLGYAVDKAKKDQAMADLKGLKASDFNLVMKVLQDAGMLKDFLDAVGNADAKEVTDQMEVEFKVPAVDFSGKGQSKVEEHYTRGNAILKPNKMKVTMESYRPVGTSWWERLLGRDQKSLIGNDKGTFNEADIDAYGKEVDKLVDTFLNAGMITSFWFSDFIEDPKLGARRELQGQAIREKTKAKYKGKEAVFMDINAAGHVLVHELGHIIGGKGEEAEHSGAKGDRDNVMYAHVLPGRTQDKLTQAQVNAFKTSIYSVISKAKTKP